MPALPENGLNFRYSSAALSRRALLLGAGAATIAGKSGHAQTSPAKIDYSIQIAPISLELAPGKTIKTTGYNGRFPVRFCGCVKGSR